MLNSFHLKLIACLLMLIDHLGRVFFPEATIMVALGRLSFPLFAWLAAQGENYTSNIWNYVFRLILLGVISQPIYSHVYSLIFSATPPLNILFVLAAGVTTIRLSKQVNNGLLKGAIVLLFTTIAIVARFEAGFFTLPLVYIMSQFHPGQLNFKWWLVYIVPHILYVALGGSVVELAGIIAPVFIYLHNGEAGIKTRWFYLFYPVHLGVIAGIKWFLTMY
ncbi:MAG: TraX family protein [Coleofasciculus sp. B1-GNL1-01]|uniref:TraX family protein n=1 Tax=Coleofasciculus sp. B1-GNL1-01 TaxID=3068484 RepID=UPI003304FC1E